MDWGHPFYGEPTVPPVEILWNHCLRWYFKVASMNRHRGNLKVAWDVNWLPLWPAVLCFCSVCLRYDRDVHGLNRGSWPLHTHKMWLLASAPLLHTSSLCPNTEKNKKVAVVFSWLLQGLHFVNATLRVDGLFFSQWDRAQIGNDSPCGLGCISPKQT